ncbi:DUF2179 domain-containing protein [Desulfatitalea alkaliphila]|uniref:DUF5698 domain-containing protein n=1 Tax=Desulfatitalea alkaliphila TaxID=2929485 RepID=A0AA41R3M2_9BACT|nr:DUF5698 domain-containing protein [Desulfatitalea alkaliphila]MCJ8500171.1 DUF5698 domain-containing protein [Desulfatitalea alkaliphila]
MFDSAVLVTGMIVFVARICDVAIGTVRTIVTVQGRTVIAFFLAFVEIVIWVLVASAVLNQVREQPLLVVFYALGYATGNVMGIVVERKLAFGLIILRVISRNAGQILAATLRAKGQPVTVFHGEGMSGPVDELYIACRRRDLKWLITDVSETDPNAFYVIEQARDVSKVLRPVHTPLGGWRTPNKRK